MTRTLRILLIGSTAALGLGGVASSADYDAPIFVENAPEYVPVEIGSGWYLRGDVGYAMNQPYDYFEAAGYTTDYSPFSGSVGMGYRFNEYFRTELNLGILPSSEFDNRYVSTCTGNETTTVVDNVSGAIVGQVSGPGTRPCDGSDNGLNKAYDLEANAYVDLGTFAGITPYVGGGVGVAYSTYRFAQGARDCRDDSSVVVGGGTTTTTDFDCYAPSVYAGAVTRERQLTFGYSLAAGFAYQVTNNIQLDVGYEYTTLPSARYISFDAAGVAGVAKGVDYHQVKVGLRYALW